MLDATTPLHLFVDGLAQRTPTPGGGATTALAAALATAQAEMVIRFSIGRKTSTPESDAALQASLTTLTHGRALLMELMAEDQEAYEAYRATRTADAAARCLLIPQSVLATGLASAEAFARVASLLNPNLVADRVVAAGLMVGSARGVAALVSTNLDASEPHAQIASQTREQIRRIESLLAPLG
jgi:formiminotetrahydrofolate cyclodeaminase